MKRPIPYSRILLVGVLTRGQHRNYFRAFLGRRKLRVAMAQEIPDIDRLPVPTYDNLMDAVQTIRAFYAEKEAIRESEARDRKSRFERQLPELVQGCLKVDPDIDIIVLFGSLAENNFPDARDIDLAIRSTQFYKVAAYLLRQSAPIDVVDLDDVYPHIRERILTTGRVLYERK